MSCKLQMLLILFRSVKRHAMDGFWNQDKDQYKGPDWASNHEGSWRQRAYSKTGKKKEEFWREDHGAWSIGVQRQINRILVWRHADINGKLMLRSKKRTRQIYWQNKQQNKWLLWKNIWYKQ